MRKFNGRKCPGCNRFFKKMDAWCSHVSTRHPKLIPEGFTPRQYLYGLETGKMESHCMYCNKPTPWNETSGKYSRLCGDRKCQEIYSQKHGTSSAEQQRLMGHNRGDTREYNYQGTIITAQGRNEWAFLEFMNNTLHWPAADIMNSPNSYTYTYRNPENDPKHDGRVNFYLPDYYIPSLNLEIEIKDQTNHRSQYLKFDRIKEAQKDEMMSKLKTVNYYKINDNEFEKFVKYISTLSLNISDQEIKEGKAQIIQAMNLPSPNFNVASEGYSSLYGLDAYDIVMERSKIDELAEIENDTGIIVICYQDTIEDLDAQYADWIDQPLNVRNDSDAISYDHFGIDNVQHYYFLRKMLENANSEDYTNPFTDENNDCTPSTEAYAKIREDCERYQDYSMLQREFIKRKKAFEKKDYTNIDQYKFSIAREGKESFHHDFATFQLPNSDLWFYANIPSNPTIQSSFFVSHDKESIFNNIAKMVNDFVAKENLEPYHLMLSKDDQESPYEIGMIQNPIYRIDEVEDIDTAIEQYADMGEDELFTPILFPAMESVTTVPDFFKISSRLNWHESLFTGNTKNVNFNTRSRVTVENGMIIIKGIASYTLFNRINERYGTKHIKNIFLLHYNPYSWNRYMKKKITRNQLRIDYISSPEFFAMELVDLFLELGEEFHDANYLGIANKIYANSWLAEADKRYSKTATVDAVMKGMKIEALPYQVEFVENYELLKSKLNLNGYILSFEQGLGKTFTAVLLAEIYKFDHIYIVCPNSLVENWAVEIKKYFDIYDDDAVWKKEVINCKNTLPKNAKKGKYFIINNESIKSIFPFVEPGKNLLIVDESHNFRNINSKRTQELIKLQIALNTKDTLLLSGTPIKALPSEIAPALSLIDPLFTPQVAEMYVKAFDSKSIEVGSLVSHRFSFISFRKEKKDVSNLPPKIIEDIPIPLSNGYEYIFDTIRNDIFSLFTEIYQEKLIANESLMREMIIMVKKYSSAPIEVTTMYCKWLTTVNTERSMRIHDSEKDVIEDFLPANVYPNIHSELLLKQLKELESKFIHMKQSAMSTAMGKILPPLRRSLYMDLFDEYIDALIDMICSNDAKTLIFSQFKPVVDYICDGLNARDVKTVKIVGETKNRMDVITDFKEDDTIRVLVATSQTVGTGFTLTEANQVFFFGPPWRDADFNQCCDRVHRIGQTRDVHIYILTLDTGSQLNVSTRMNNILNWSHDMFNSIIVDADNRDIEEFAKALDGEE